MKVVSSINIDEDVEVEVAKLVSFGAFARLDNGIEGLIHVTELGGDGDAQKPEDVLEIGQKVKARVITIDNAERKIGLSIRAFQKNESAKLQADHGVSGGEGVDSGVNAASSPALAGAGMSLADSLMASVKPQEKVTEPTESAAPEVTADAEAEEAPVEEGLAPEAKEEAPVEEAASDDASES